jgi:hypothetical protein
MLTCSESFDRVFWSSSITHPSTKVPYSYTFITARHGLQSALCYNLHFAWGYTSDQALGWQMDMRTDSPTSIKLWCVLYFTNMHITHIELTREKARENVADVECKAINHCHVLLALMENWTNHNEDWNVIYLEELPWNSKTILCGTWNTS